MFSDSITSSIPSTPRDFNKKKRAHRSAKLKQCKLDARREQWLSQVSAVKKGGGKGESVAGRGLGQACVDERRNGLGNLDTRRREVGNGEIGNGIVHNDFDLDSPSNSPTGSSVLGGNDSGTNFTTSSSSSGSSGGCYSGNITEDEEGGGDGEDDDCLDDWEAVADALAADDDKSNNNANKQEGQNENLCLDPDSSPRRESTARSDCKSNKGCCPENSRLESARKVAPSRVGPANSRAWRPDDAFRPQSLPNLSKQRSFPNTDRHYGHGGIAWGRVSAATVPSSCPICYEDLDFTDTSFLPCLCGFRLCLFCHKRILEEDGRCPGCRKPYEHDPVEAEPSVHGGSLTFKLARSCSMIDRS